MRKEYTPYVPVDDSTAYGVPNRPSTPIKAVVEGFFGDVAAEQTQARYDVLNRPGTSKNGRRFSELRNHTRASQLAQSFVNASSTKINDSHMRSTS